MDWDDAEPESKARSKTPEPRIPAKVLEGLSIAELEGYIVTLEEEIQRARAVIKQKLAARAGADTFFKPKTSSGGSGRGQG